MSTFAPLPFVADALASDAYLRMVAERKTRFAMVVLGLDGTLAVTDNNFVPYKTAQGPCSKEDAVQVAFGLRRLGVAKLKVQAQVRKG